MCCGNLVDTEIAQGLVYCLCDDIVALLVATFNGLDDLGNRNGRYISRQFVTATQPSLRIEKTVARERFEQLSGCSWRYAYVLGQILTILAALSAV